VHSGYNYSHDCSAANGIMNVTACCKHACTVLAILSYSNEAMPSICCCSALYLVMVSEVGITSPLRCVCLLLSHAVHSGGRHVCPIQFSTFMTTSLLLLLAVNIYSACQHACLYTAARVFVHAAQLH
jgi:hypothetical protein